MNSDTGSGAAERRVSSDGCAVTTALSDELQAAAGQIAQVPNLLVCIDFDGTLAPIVEDPALARALPASVSALLALAELPGTTTAVVSGRALRDLATLSGLPLQVQLVGSHGSEFEAGFVAALDDAASQRRNALLDAVRPLVDGIPGVLLEEKPTGVAVHVRRTSRQDAAAVLASLRRGPARSPGVFATEGHEVLELSVVRSDKGHAIDELRARSRANAVIFVGDDVTDERAFLRLTGPDVGVKVGAGTTAAAYRVAGPDQVASLLALLVHERASWLAAAPGRGAASAG
jgi:trehalose-phosphatase